MMIAVTIAMAIAGSRGLGDRGRGTTRELLCNSYEIGVFAREVKPLSKPVAERRIKTVAERGDFIDILPVLATSFV
jgi:hypothetical protein